MVLQTRPFVCALALLVLASSSRSALADWPDSPMVNLPICTLVNDQDVTGAVSDGSGGIIVVWRDDRGGAESDLYVQRVSVAGVPLWTANGLALCTAPGDQIESVIASDGAGGAIVAWHDNRTGGTRDVYVQRVSSAGAPKWTADGVALTTAPGDQHDARIVADGGGGAIVAWKDGASDPPRVFAQRVNAAGVPQWTAGGVALDSSGTEGSIPSAIVADGAGGAIVAWTATRGPSLDVFVQRVDASGLSLWGPNGVALCGTAAWRLDPAIVSDGAGGAIVAYVGYGVGYDIHAQRVDASGVRLWAPEGVAVCSAAGDQAYQGLTSDGAGGAIVAWLDLADTGIHAQRVDAAGTAKWTAGGVVLCPSIVGQPYLNSSLQPIRPMADGAGGAIVPWFGTPNSDVYAQKVNADGAVQWGTGGAALSTANHVQADPRIVTDDAGGAICAWGDGRSGQGWDVYAQNVKEDGTLGGTALATSEPALVGAFGLRLAGRNPFRGRLAVAFSVPDNSSATIELFDLGGRLIESRPVGGPGSGVRVASFTCRPAPGVYSVRLVQGARRAVVKVVLLD
jgi:hypothetical protein